MTMSPEHVAHGCSPVGIVEAKREGEGHVEAPNVEKVVRQQSGHMVQLPMGSFSSGIPSTPGRGFVEFDTSRRSDEQLDVQLMDVSDAEEHMKSAEEVHLEANPAILPTLKPSAMLKVKAPRREKSSLRPRQVGHHSRSSEAMEYSGLDREVESSRATDVDDELADIIMFEAENVEGTSIDLNVSSHVEEVVGVVLEVLGQGRSSQDYPAVVVAEEPSVVKPSNEAEVAWSFELK